MIKNSQGQIALKWAIPQRNPPMNGIEIGGTNRRYIPVLKNNVGLIWADPIDVQLLTTKKHKICNCSNGVFKEMFILASRLDVLLYITNSRDEELPDGILES